MKKFFTLIKAKENNEKTPSDSKKPDNSKAQKAAAPNEKASDHPRDLFWDDYSDIGYC